MPGVEVEVVNGGDQVPTEDDSKSKVSLCSLLRFATKLDVALMTAGMVFGVINGAAYPVCGFILGGLFDDLNDPSANIVEITTTYSIYFVYLVFASFVASFIQWAGFGVSGARQAYQMRRAYLKSLLSQDIAYFDKNRSGALSSQLAANLSTVQEGLGEKLGNAFQFSSMFITGLVVGFVRNYKLSLVVLACIPLLGIAGFFIIKVISDGTKKSLAAYSKAGAIAEESIGMIRTIASFGGEKYTTQRYDKHLAEAETAGIHQKRFHGLAFGFTMGIFFMVYAPVFWYGTVLIKDDRIAATSAYPLNSSIAPAFCAINQAAPTGCNANGDFFFQTEVDVCGCGYCKCGCFYPGSDCMTAGDVLLVFISVVLAGLGLGQALPSIQSLIASQGAAVKIMDVIDREPEAIEKDRGAITPSVVQGAISFNDITFSYPTRLETRVLRNFSLDINAGETVALCGSSGSGKSTTVLLLERFYAPSSGVISLDGQDISKLNVDWLRSQMGIVNQEPILFATTISKNIAQGKVGVSQEEIEEAAKKANAHDFIIALPEGYDTILGEKGALLSGGQKQRVCIARALIRDPKILILDEATSALDNRSEQIVQEALDNLLVQKRRTTIVIAHRLTTIRNADKIVVMGDGQLLEQGTHDELLELDGHYTALLQASQSTAAPKESESAVVPCVEEIGSEDESEGDSVKAAEDVPEEQVARKSTDVREVSSVVVPISQGKSKKKKRVPLSRLVEYSRPEAYLYAVGAVAATVNGAKEPAFAILFSGIITVLYNPQLDQMVSDSKFYVYMFIILAVCAFFGGFLMTAIFGYVGEKMTRRLRLDLFQKLLIQDIEFFDRPANSIGALTSKLATDAGVVKSALSDQFGMGVSNLAATITGLAIAFSHGWQLTLVCVCVLPFIAAGSALQFILRAQITDGCGLQRASQILSESVNGIRTVRAFGIEHSVNELFCEYLVVPEKEEVKMGIKGGIGFGFSQGSQFLLYTIAFRYGGVLVSDGTYSFKDLITVIFAILMTAIGIGQSFQVAPEIGKAKEACIKVFGIIDRKITINNPEKNKTAIVPVSSKGDLSVQDIKFAYPTRKHVTVFDGFTLDINSGKTVALVGESGQGKSSIIQLLERFYDTRRGQVCLDGKDIKDLNVSWYRSQIGCVSQEPQLFRGTVAENIAFGAKDEDKNVPMEDIIEAAKAANAHDFITQLPHGYDEVVGSSTLSGGQKQRICIARALVRNPKILLLDEATSALDNASERIVQQALDDLLATSKRTTVIVAHRLSTIRNADMIVVCHQGQAVEVGTHDQLLARNGLYAKLLATKA
eukprot:CAMPEP_0203744408 /NCGR_PEP_ID=MMETSP0098-20131031/488_1 /ASSEMBLY_ACC=CAM_ASM_000208 /TAXON_ID=96639 /ORGANISM=" , Strain NY0313808BC1" /LENGTH=1311 /DNA_ID=CAMNT_0050631915 /DNA_START=347 /DNA_END=4282 /DNA_ORIENTATION=-